MKKSLALYELHFEKNAIYRKFCEGINRTPERVKGLSDIPFMPIEFFKNHRIYISDQEPQLDFKSSGTTKGILKRSTHYIDELERYQKALEFCFSNFFNSKEPLSLFALLPGYVQNSSSSLIFMLEELNKLNMVNLKGYYLEDHSKLIADIEIAKNKGEKVLLWGVTFGLLDFSEKHSLDLKGHIVLETGGMKGRRKEVTRGEVHSVLKRAFNVGSIYSEYGMTELLSQSYSNGNGLFKMNENFGVLVRDVYDPLSYQPIGISGVLNIIDLANEHSCPFIATQDLGRVYENALFEVLGRTDNSDVRGCNLLAV
ncbi:MAG: acyl transferase [Bacteroidia bacterium]